MANPLRAEVLTLYKNVSVRALLQPQPRALRPSAQNLSSLSFKLLYLGRDYPKGADYFRSRLKAAFLKNKAETDPEKIKQLLARGEFVIKELEALYFLRKYRALKQRYYSDDS